MSYTCFFDSKDNPGVKEVGGKGLSLVQMTRKQFPVPPGFILKAGFFAPWFTTLKNTPAWQQFLKTTPETLKQDCAALKALSAKLEFDAEQEKALADSLAVLDKQTELKLYAVRSSSPEEDLEGASFAGGYETLLGVKPGDIQAAVRQAFASCLDERIFLYKQERGFPVFEPQIAVIIQVQIPSEVSGVAFSLNPLNNCYDEVVINANSGLGESVVAGQVSPDQYIVDKVTGRIISAQTGRKETAVWLDKAGGTYTEPAADNNINCLSNEQVKAVAELTSRVETAYGNPIDIEWAFASDRLYLLQARPVTAYFPLPDEMQTAPGERRRLYLDMFLAKQGIHEAFSVLGLDYMSYMQKVLFKDMMGMAIPQDLRNGLFFNSGGRGYLNLSNNLKLRGKKGVIWAIQTQDTLSVEILKHLDAKAYIARRLPREIKFAVIKTVLKSLDAIKLSLRAFKNPGQYHDFFLEGVKKLTADLIAEEKKELSGESPLEEFVTNTVYLTCRFINSVSLPMTYAAEMARAKIKKLFAKEEEEVRKQVVHLEQALPDNVTIEMGLAMYNLALHEDVTDCSTGAEFADKLQARSLSPAFLAAWDVFMEKYGCRCPKELDAGTPRFYEKPDVFFNQLSSLARNTDPENNPRAIYEKGIKTRESTFRVLLDTAKRLGKAKAKKFEKYYNVLTTFGGYREIHKYYYIKILDMFRRRVLTLADSFLAAGRLTTREQIFDLNVAEIDRAVTDKTVNLPGLAETNTRYLKRIAHIRNFPRIIDSRGKIFHAPKKEARDGELAGEPISPGKVRGTVKVLAYPDEKPLLPGEILVARATDPGWTPLFLNAGGIVLEVGGLLQHGALVAREYCKPCVAGIEHVTALLKDGQVIEMDGASGLVRLV